MTQEDYEERMDQLVSCKQMEIISWLEYFKHISILAGLAYDNKLKIR